MSYAGVLALAFSHKEVFYHEFGSYEGEWLAITSHDDKYFIWHGGYGSCTVCDPLENFLDRKDKYYNDGELSIEEAKEFFDGKTPFLEIGKDHFDFIVEIGEHNIFIPRNIREYYPREEVEEFFANLKKELLNEN